MSKRCGMEDDILGSKWIYIRKVVHQHRQQVAMSQHSSLGLTSGARGIKQPGEIIWINLGITGDRVGAREQCLIIEGTCNTLNSNNLQFRYSLAGLVRGSGMLTCCH